MEAVCLDAEHLALKKNLYIIAELYLYINKQSEYLINTYLLSAGNKIPLRDYRIVLGLLMWTTCVFLALSNPSDGK